MKKGARAPSTAFTRKRVRFCEQETMRKRRDLRTEKRTSDSREGRPSLVAHAHGPAHPLGRTRHRVTEGEAVGNPAHSRRKAVGRTSVARSFVNVSAESGSLCGRLGCDCSQVIDGFLFGHAGVASHPVPRHFVPGAGAPQFLPEGLILNRRAVA